MEFSSDQLHRPRGGQIYPFIGGLEEDLSRSFAPNIAELFKRAIDTGELHGRRLLSSAKRGRFRSYLENPKRRSSFFTPEERQHEANEKHHCLRFFVLDRGQVYRMPVEEKNHFYNLRYVACTWDAGDIIAKAHLKLHHASKSPFLIVYVRYTDVYRGREGYQTLQDYYYGISEKAVAWVLDKCALCKLSSRNEGRATIKPIVAKHCMNWLVIDLMDFRSQADDGFKWILQIKDHFS
jgi:hypothetical protein